MPCEWLNDGRETGTLSKISVMVQQSCCLSCPPSENWFLAVKKTARVKCIQPTPHTTSNYIKTEEECVAISFQIHWVIFLGGERVLLQQQLNIDVPNAAVLLGWFWPLSELCLCFVVFKCILNRVNLNHANTSHFIKLTVKCLNLHVVNFLLHPTRKS